MHILAIFITKLTFGDVIMKTEILHPTLANTTIRVHNGRKSNSEGRWFDWHMHNEFELLIVTEGEKIYYIENNTFPLCEGDIIFLNSNVPHKTFQPGNSRSTHVQFQATINPGDLEKKDFLFHFINHTSTDIAIFKKGTPINAQLSECIIKSSTEHAKQLPSYDLFIKGYVYQILAILYRNNIINNPEDFFSSHNIEKVLPVLNYIDKHFAENVTLDEMSRMLNIDKSYFCRIFKKAVNTTFTDYLNFVRICHAEKLLTTTDKSISEISYQVGFSSLAYFTKTFKEYKNCTPSIYKKASMTEIEK